MGLFSKKKTVSHALFDIDSSSVGGALAHAPAGEAPTIYYTFRQKITPKEHEDAAEAMYRTLEEVTADLVQKGAPILRQETGSGHSDQILVSVGAPWQKTVIRMDTISDKNEFTFTKAILADATHRGEDLPPGYIKSNESVIAILLNGYETSEPYGKKVHRADMLLLSSLLDKAVSSRVEQILRKTYHTHALSLIAFAPIAYSVFRDVYPHEKDFLVVEVSGEATNLVFVKNGLLVNVADVEYGINSIVRNIHETAQETGDSASAEAAEGIWLAKIAETLQGFSTNYALPRTIFLLADADSRDYFRTLMDSQNLRSLWLTNDPLRVIPVVPQHFANVVKTRGNAEGDVYLELLTLYNQSTSKP